jgi:hypothetical protein
MDDPYLAQLKEQRGVIEALLQAERVILKPQVSDGISTAIQIYTHILEDALATVTRLIHYLEQKTGGNDATPLSYILQDRQRHEDQPE